MQLTVTPRQNGFVEITVVGATGWLPSSRQVTQPSRDFHAQRKKPSPPFTDLEHHQQTSSTTPLAPYPSACPTCTDLCPSSSMHSPPSLPKPHLASCWRHSSLRTSGHQLQQDCSPRGSSRQPLCSQAPGQNPSETLNAAPGQDYK